MAIECSIVIPTFKRPALLARCLTALYDQDFPADRYEIIVVTDGPDRGTLAMTETIAVQAPRLQVISPAVKKGPAAARNIGWSHASGDLVFFTDDDCIPDRQWVRAYREMYGQYVESLLHNNGEVAFRGPVSVPRPRRPTDHEKNTAGLETAEFVTANCGCTRMVLEKTGGFDESFSMAWREDSDFQFKILMHAIPILYVPGAAVTHPVRKAPWGISLQEQKKSMYNALLYKRHPHLFRQKIYRFPFWNYYAIAILAMTAILSAWRGVPLIAWIAGGGWAVLTVSFIIKRLHGASLSIVHIAEMVLTSILIPFLSLFWTWYGMFRFKIFFL